MGLFTRSFDKPGKGVDPNAPQKRSFFRFFDIFFRKFWHFVRVNLIYALTLIPTFVVVFVIAGIVSNGILSLPNMSEMLNSLAQQMAESAGDAGLAEYQRAQLIVTFDLFVRFVITYLFVVFWGMGPATAGVTYVLRNFAREEHAWIWSDFKDALKSNFKQSIVVFIIDVVVFVLLYFAITFYMQMPGLIGALRYIIIIVTLVYTLMHFYIYPLMVTFQLSLKDLYRNSMLFALGKLPSNLLVFLILLLVHMGSVFAAVFFGGSYSILILIVILLLEVFILLSFSAFLVNFNAYPKMKKYMLTNTEDPVKSDIFSETKSEEESKDMDYASGMYDTYTNYREFVDEKKDEESSSEEKPKED
ncbi:YesL family protein [Ructibacterium gallinarum]|uniref:DUF624 domain-containing protein n=1 Tax=Ructibacterium gallinarum TaxID=2779355 RepID=A0A9D5M3I7_9FIRM|nr:DUF624 domain-containing protein [Ructibacterium gallinarum]MBE5038899.1 DUF624 domain-containing protein [Ructibacterium gallinarum]